MIPQETGIARKEIRRIMRGRKRYVNHSVFAVQTLESGCYFIRPLCWTASLQEARKFTRKKEAKKVARRSYKAVVVEIQAEGDD